MTESTAILIFARDPDREVKPLGRTPSRVRQLHCRLFTQALTTALEATEGTAAAVWVATERIRSKLPVPPGVGRVVQSGNGFEGRLRSSIGEVFQRGHARVIVIGTDTPALSVSDLKRALASPRSVIGPATDGGCYLFSVRPSQLADLSGLPWCTSDLGKELSRALSKCSGTEMLSPKNDLDVRSDVLRCRDRLRELRLWSLVAAPDPCPSGRPRPRRDPFLPPRVIATPLPDRAPPFLPIR